MNDSKGFWWVAFFALGPKAIVQAMLLAMALITGHPSWGQVFDGSAEKEAVQEVWVSSWTHGLLCWTGVLSQPG